MPTPSISLPDTPQPPLDDLHNSVIDHRTAHTTCPPDDDCIPTDLVEVPPTIDAPGDESNLDESSREHGAVHVEISTSEQSDSSSPETVAPHESDTDVDIARDSPSPESAEEESRAENKSSPVASPIISPTPFAAPFHSGAAGHYSHTPKHQSTFLKAGSVYEGTQQSDRQVYNVQVELKHVDMTESFVCGYLRIEGLTSEHPTLTTYFEGEIIGTKYSFLTGHPEWGSNEKVDLQHWNRFPAWRPLQKQARKPDYTFKDFAQREHLFMRWKEYFLVPDHKVRSISGASFEGFYYICFNQISGTVSGIYFHSKSEKYQQLELKHVDDHGCTAAMEFR